MKRLFSVLMMVLMMVSLFTTAHAELLNEGIQEGTIQVGEVEELRQANSETYRRADGTYECVVYAEDKYYKDDNGNYTEIDNSVVPAKHVNDKKEYAFANKANSEHFCFADKEPAILISSEECALAFQADVETDVKAAVGGLENREAISGYTLAGENYIAYGSAFKDTDLVYKVNNGLLKEYIVLYSPASPTKFTFTFNTANYSVKYTEDGLIGFYEADGKLRFELGELFAVDSVGSYTNELSYRIDLAKYGKTKITVSISDDFTKAPERVYPILIDPSVVISGSNKIQDAFVSSKYPNQNYYSDDYLRMGWSSSYKISRSYIRFELPQSIQGGVITESYMSLKKVDCGNAPSLKAYCVKKSWSSKTIKWNNKADYMSNNASAEAEPKTNNWYRFYVTDIVKKWYNGTYPNYGFMVKNNSESGSGNWSTFYSSDVDLSYKPELRIKYEKKYTIRYYGNGNTAGVVPLSQSSESGAVVVIRTNSGKLVKKDCEFLGWNTLPSGNGVSYAEGQYITMPDNDITLYAKWGGEKREVGLEAISNYSGTGLPTLSTSVDCVNGIYNALSSYSDSWMKKYTFTDKNVWELDFKSVSLGGNDWKCADSVDLLAYCGHGYRDMGLVMSNQSNSDAYVSRSDLLLGDVDLEWFLTFTCNFLNCNKDDIGRAMNGLHVMCGYKTDMTVTANGGYIFALYASLGGKSVIEAWRMYGVLTQDIQNANKTAAFFHVSCANDHLWGFGDTASDPPAYNDKTKKDYYFVEYNAY